MRTHLLSSSFTGITRLLFICSSKTLFTLDFTAKPTLVKSPYITCWSTDRSHNWTWSYGIWVKIVGLSKLGLQLSRPNKYTPASLTKLRIAYFHIKLHSWFDQLWLICFIQPSEWKKLQHSVRYLLIGWHSYQPHFNQKKINRHAHTHSIDVNIVWKWTHRNLLLFSFRV